MLSVGCTTNMQIATESKKLHNCSGIVTGTPLTQELAQHPPGKGRTLAAAIMLRKGGHGGLQILAQEAADGSLIFATDGHLQSRDSSSTCRVTCTLVLGSLTEAGGRQRLLATLDPAAKRRMSRARARSHDRHNCCDVADEGKQKRLASATTGAS